MLLLILSSSIIVLITIWCIIYYKYDRYLKHYPGPIPLPLIGHALHYGSIKKFLPTSMEFHKKYGPVVKVQIAFEPPVIEITDPRLIEIVLGSTKFLHKSSDYKYIERWLGRGLLTSEPIKWKKHRRILTPAFHFQILEQFINTFNVYSTTLVDKMKTIVGNNSVDIYPFVALCSLDIICATSMGTAVNAQTEGGTSKYVGSVKKMSHILMDRIVSLTSAYDVIYRLTPSYQAQEETVKVLHDYTKSVIASRKQELQQNWGLEKKEDSDFGIKERNTFLDTLLKHNLQGGSVTDDEIREEVDTFMFEGHDTISSALSFTMYSLANNLEVQKKVVDELRHIFGDEPGRPATSKDLQEMKYLEMVIKESLRLYPPVAIFGRGVVEDAEFDGKILPKGVTLSIFAYGVHRNPEIYPDPEKFDPERFTLENQASRSPYAYIPFSAGSRNCIGQRFAMLEMKSVISKVLRSYELFPSIPAHELELVSELTLKSKSGVNIRVENRKWNT